MVSHILLAVSQRGNFVIFGAGTHRDLGSRLLSIHIRATFMLIALADAALKRSTFTGLQFLSLFYQLACVLQH